MPGRAHKALPDGAGLRVGGACEALADPGHGNQCRKVFRAPWRRTEPLEDYADRLGFEQPEDRGLFLAVMELERKYRLPVLLYYYEGYSTAEIASILDMPPNTVSTRLARARAQLRKKLTEVE